MQKITKLDNIYAVTPSPDIYKERQALQAEFDILSTSCVENLLLRTRSRYYEEGDKAGRLLALQLRQEATSHLIPQIKTPSGTTTDPILINNHFKDYYTSLYTSEQTANLSDFDNFFSTLSIPTVDSNFVDQLEVVRILFNG